MATPSANLLDVIRMADEFLDGHMPDDRYKRMLISAVIALSYEDLLNLALIIVGRDGATDH